MYMVYYIPNGNIPIQNVGRGVTRANCLSHPNSVYAKYDKPCRPNKFRTKNDAEYCLSNLLGRFPLLVREEFDIVRI